MADTTTEQVLSIVAGLNNKDNTANAEKLIHEEVTLSNSKENKKFNVMKGKPKSGRFWKSSRER